MNIFITVLHLLTFKSAQKVLKNKEVQSRVFSYPRKVCL